MKSAPTDSPLDTFIKNTLKAPDANLHPVDWNEVEVLLCNEHKSILMGVSKKTILISVTVVIIVIAAFSIINMVQYYSALPANKPLIDSMQSAFSIIDTNSANAMEPITSKTDTLKIDSFSLPSESSAQAGLAENKQLINSANSITTSDTTSLKKTSDVPASTYIKTAQNQDKKQKQNTVHTYSPMDSASEKKDSMQRRSMDTVSTDAAQEIKNETSNPIDTNVKNLTPLKNTSKNKKSKSKQQQLLQPQNNPQLNLPETKFDSLKQQ